MTAYKIVHYDYYGNSVGEVEAASVNYTNPLNDIPSITYDVPIESELAKQGLCDPDRHDWKLFADNTPVAGGFVYTVAVDTANRVLNVTGQGYLGYLAQRIMRFDPTGDLNLQNYARNNADLFDIVRGWLAFSLGSGSTTIPLQYDSSMSGFMTSMFFDCSARTDLLSNLKNLAAAQPGFDFEISQDCVLSLFPSQKGSYSSLILELHTNVANMSVTDNGIKGTRVSATGAGVGNSQAARWVTSPAQGRIKDDVIDFGTLQSFTQLAGLTTQELALAVQKQEDFTVTAKPSPYDDLWSAATPGDYIKVRADLEYRQINGWYRCTQIQATPTDQGDDVFIYSFGTSVTG